MTLHELQRRLKPFEIGNEVVSVIEDTTGDIVKANQDQLGLGLLSSGKEIKSLQTGSFFYSRSWESYRRSLGLQVEYFDLKVTGAFWRSIGVDTITKTTYDIDASDSKTDDLTRMFGNEILGLSDDSKARYVREVFAPELFNRIHLKLGV
jgi:hypothetical protein